ncbi:transcriptional initiation protein Tat [Haloprofundus sp. MHR1]|uniref:transcriptional initiation protein Tat n=1 Tax=Haloprofundus sp. MHR1 TaxID=2572921 RepID=UPI0010BE3BBC|nr:transcriptional initiation protein Tat [Haloprofundus sp. MHR1]QCJ48347.1 transcriptional initiation protein Tat [Haloprofundus sp. MHR1]
MKRRTFVTALLPALSAGCLSSLPRATGPRGPPEAPASEPGETPEPDHLSIETFDYEGTDDDQLRAFGTVDNRSPEERTGVVRVRVTVDDEETVGTTEVTVPGDSTAEFETVVPVSFETFRRNGQLQVTVEAAGSD